MNYVNLRLTVGLFICRSKVTKKASDLADVSKPLKSEKEKKADALANIDINNYASKYFSN